MKIISRNGNEKFVKEVLTLEKLFSWKMLGVFFTFSYCPALGLRVQKNPSSNVALGKKFVNMVARSVFTGRYMENLTDSPHRALTKFIKLLKLSEISGLTRSLVDCWLWNSVSIHYINSHTLSP